VNDDSSLDSLAYELPLVRFLAARLGVTVEEAESKLGDCLLSIAAESARRSDPAARLAEYD
jgi:hypothetical protein